MCQKPLSTANTNVNAVGSWGYTALSYTVKKENYDAVKLLLAYIPGNVLHSKMWSIKRISEKIDQMRSLGAQQSIQINARESGGRTALQTAAIGRIDEGIKYLIERKDGQARDKERQTALGIARESGHAEISQLLTSEKARRKK
ncbi:uncharacterized protein BDR25DRAFT_319744 [Lindgomyces ingoldianus]|uniref:Uncharacterized protein n=1 Tax=Lindgomyces ingoldianus TaxID=673940 RepID=A0ACB6QC38_9PLEO|nr:uncharacterized protein BDR25DRAFT_319744 [Lindgomyces ingoldianus]KAF2463716.1 hypothetical protein BDR25DRAFT_319744 [Lindgomyces ingoldianus]